jgi:hypothetical protein
VIVLISFIVASDGITLKSRVLFPQALASKVPPDDSPLVRFQKRHDRRAKIRALEQSKLSKLNEVNTTQRAVTHLGSFVTYASVLRDS